MTEGKRVMNDALWRTLKRGYRVKWQEMNSMVNGSDSVLESIQCYYKSK